MAQKKVAEFKPGEKEKSTTITESRNSLLIHFSMDDYDALETVIRAITVFHDLVADHQDDEVNRLYYLMKPHVENLREIADHIHDSWQVAAKAAEGGAQ